MELLFTLIMIMVSVSFFSLFERKLLSMIQNRKGPNKVSVMGILQPFSDAVKLVTKNDSSPNESSKMMYLMSPFLFLLISLMLWVSMIYTPQSFNMSIGIITLMVVFSVSVYGLIIMGFCSNSKYSILGATRAVVQSISYELILSFSLMNIMMLTLSASLWKTLEIQQFVWNLFLITPVWLIMLISLLAETNRSPFDLTESESELVSGYCIEYGGISYTVIFMAENMSLLFQSYILSLMFLFGVMMPLKMSMNVFLMVWIRGTVPRIRFDKIMMFCWLMIMPFTVMISIIIPLMVSALDSKSQANMAEDSLSYGENNIIKGM